MNYKISDFVPRTVLGVVILVSLTACAWATAKETVLHSFGGTGDGAIVEGGLVADATGNLYGTTASGGSGDNCIIGGCGTVFELSAQQNGTWKETVLYSFLGGDDGGDPVSSLIFDHEGNLYGTTAQGGVKNCIVGSTPVGCGVVFELSPPGAPGTAWTETTLYEFTGGSDGSWPQSSLVFDSAGNLYSVTYAGGDLNCMESIDNNAPGCGTVFKLAPPAVKGGDWTESTLYAFHGGNDGASPTQESLIVYGDGTLLGTTSSGGGTSSDCEEEACGTVFALQQEHSGSWKETILYRFAFSNGTSPAEPTGALVIRQGSIYGTTLYGGNFHGGVVYQLTPSKGMWSFSLIHQFGKNSTDGFGPFSGVIADAAGNFYGTTEVGGDANCDYPIGCGAVFELSPPSGGNENWTETILWDFEEGKDGGGPVAVPTLLGGSLYGTTVGGGGHDQNCSTLGFAGCGTVFRLTR